MKTKPLAYVGIAAICGLLGSCTTTPMVSVKTDYNKAAPFGQYRTFALDPRESALGPTGRAALHDALRSGLAARGMREAPTGSADLFVTPSAFTTERADVIPTGNTVYYPSDRGTVRGGTWTLAADVREYTEGTLVVDFIDRRKRELVFRGVGRGVVGTTERNAAAIKKAVEDILAQFPKGASQ